MKLKRDKQHARRMRTFVLEEECQSKEVELPTGCGERLLQGVGKSSEVTQIPSAEGAVQQRADGLADRLTSG